MKLLIHDFSQEEWEREAENYAGWEVISDRGEIKPCVGCFGCWTKTPGTCVIKDGYERMGLLIHQADEVLVISRYTYGGFSSFVKNVIDRSIAWVLPFFEIVDEEMHHKKRYPEDKPFSFVFRGIGLTDEDKARAKQYVEAVCRNFHGTIKNIRFEKIEDTVAVKLVPEAETYRKTILLNCSMRGNNANTKKLLDRLANDIEGDKESVNLAAFAGRSDELVGSLLAADRIVLGMPLYVDGIPSAALRIMESLEKYENIVEKKVYAVTNMGFYESVQQKNLLGMIRTWCGRCGYTYGGAAAVGAGEMVGPMTASPNADKGGPARTAALALKKLAEAVNASAVIEDIYADAYKFPRFLYMLAANMGWPRMGRKNGLKKKDLYVQPESVTE